MGNIVHTIFCQTDISTTEKRSFDMKATGIVRRIDDYVIIGYKVGKP